MNFLEVESLLNKKSFFGTASLKFNKSITEDDINILFSTQETKVLFENMPKMSVIIELLNIYKLEHGLNFTDVYVTEDEDISRNLLFKRNRSWILTAKALYEILTDAFAVKNVEIDDVSAYLVEQGVSYGN